MVNRKKMRILHCVNKESNKNKTIECSISPVSIAHITSLRLLWRRISRLWRRIRCWCGNVRLIPIRIRIRLRRGSRCRYRRRRRRVIRLRHPGVLLRYGRVGRRRLRRVLLLDRRVLGRRSIGRDRGVLGPWRIARHAVLLHRGGDGRIGLGIRRGWLGSGVDGRRLGSGVGSGGRRRLDVGLSVGRSLLGVGATVLRFLGSGLVHGLRGAANHRLRYGLGRGLGRGLRYRLGRGLVGGLGR